MSADAGYTMNYKKLDYRKNQCYCGDISHFQTDVLEEVEGILHWTGVAFHQSEQDAIELVAKLQEELQHEKTCRNRVSWFWNSNLKIDRRREIDQWYNSLTDEQRKMINDVAEDARESLRSELLEI